MVTLGLKNYRVVILRIYIARTHHVGVRVRGGHQTKPSTSKQRLVYAGSTNSLFVFFLYLFCQKSRLRTGVLLKASFLCRIYVRME